MFVLIYRAFLNEYALTSEKQEVSQVNFVTQGRSSPVLLDAVNTMLPAIPILRISTNLQHNATQSQQTSTNLSIKV